MKSTKRMSNNSSVVLQRTSSGNREGRRGRSRRKGDDCRVPDPHVFHALLWQQRCPGSLRLIFFFVAASCKAKHLLFSIEVLKKKRKKKKRFFPSSPPLQKQSTRACRTRLSFWPVWKNQKCHVNFLKVQYVKFASSYDLYIGSHTAHK